MLFHTCIITFSFCSAGVWLLVWEWVYAICLYSLSIWECWTLWKEFSWSFCGWRPWPNSWVVGFFTKSFYLHLWKKDSVYVFWCILIPFLFHCQSNYMIVFPTEINIVWSSDVINIFCVYAVLYSLGFVVLIHIHFISI